MIVWRHYTTGLVGRPGSTGLLEQMPPLGPVVGWLALAPAMKLGNPRAEPAPGRSPSRQA